MGSLIANLLPLIVGAAVLPLWIIMTLIMLRGEGGLVKAAAFVGGAITVRVLQFSLFSRVFGAIISAEGEVAFDLIPSTLILMAGLLLVITAVKTWWSKEEDPDAPPPRWMTILGQVSALQAYGMAVVMMAIAIKQWVFTLSAIAVIDEAKLGRVGSVLAFVFFVLVAHSPMLAPIIGSAVAPAHSAKMLEMMLGWLERNTRVITIVVSLAFGAWFLAKGTTALLAHGDSTRMSAN